MRRERVFSLGKEGMYFYRSSQVKKFFSGYFLLPIVRKCALVNFLLSLLIDGNFPLMPRGHILSLAAEKGCKESAKGEIVFSPFEPLTRPLRRVS